MLKVVAFLSHHLTQPNLRLGMSFPQTNVAVFIITSYNSTQLIISDVILPNQLYAEKVMSSTYQE